MPPTPRADRPISSAASNPDRQPSSWNPYPRCAPANHVRRRPCRSATPRCASSVRKVYIGWLNVRVDDDRFRPDSVARIERDAVLDRAVDGLKPVHVIRHGERIGRPAAIRRADVPRARARGFDGRSPIVGVEDDLVLRVLEAAEHLALAGVGVIKQTERVVGVRRHDDGIEPRRGPGARGDPDADGVARDRRRPRSPARTESRPAGREISRSTYACEPPGPPATRASCRSR